MRSKLIIGNWKMHGDFGANKALLATLKALRPECRVAVCPPAIYLQQCRDELTGSAITWGAQDVSPDASGACTGELAATMLADVGATYVLIGHSELRTRQEQSDALIAAKVRQALAAGLSPVLCVGETLAEREARQTLAVVSRQLGVVLEGLSLGDAQRLVLAYEPVWAIGTGLTATPATAQEVHHALRSQLTAFNPAVGAAAIILYGGSMKAANATALLAMPDIDGGLIGGASLVAAEFSAIVEAAAAVNAAG